MHYLKNKKYILMISIQKQQLEDGLKLKIQKIQVRVEIITSLML